MKNFKYVLLFVIGLMATSCTEEVVGPVNEDDPIAIPPPPIKP